MKLDKCVCSVPNVRLHTCCNACSSCRCESFLQVDISAFSASRLCLETEYYTSIAVHTAAAPFNGALCTNSTLSKGHYVAVFPSHHLVAHTCVLEMIKTLNVNSGSDLVIPRSLKHLVETNFSKTHLILDNISESYFFEIFIFSLKKFETRRNTKNLADISICNFSDNF